MCQFYNNNISGGDFLNAYHSCLSSGCYMDANNQVLLREIHRVTETSVPIVLRQQYWTMALLGEVRADNWEKVRDNLIRGFSGNNMLNRIVMSNTFSTGGALISDTLSAIPFTLSLNGSSQSLSNAPFVNYGAFGEFANRNQPGNGLDSRSLRNNGALLQNLRLQNFDSTLNNQSNSSNIFNSLNNQLSGFSSSPSNNDERRFGFRLPCPFQPIQWPNFPPLSGSFSGCCDIPKCYIPRIKIRKALSEIASYITMWTTWIPCSTTCGGGRQIRRRFCIGSPCGPPEEEQRICNSFPCPVYGPWSEYSSCSATCGRRARQTRTRLCMGPGECLGPSSQTRRCARKRCPNLVKGSWSPCSSTCGEGTQTRIVTCRPRRGVTCPPDMLERRSCKEYCGRVRRRRVCDRTTCFFVNRLICVQADGTPGYCRQENLREKQSRKKCYTGRCCNFHNPRNRNVC